MNVTEFVIVLQWLSVVFNLFNNMITALFIAKSQIE